MDSMDDEPPNIVGAQEIRDMLGVSRQRVYQLAGRSDFPRPVAKLAQGTVWLSEEVEAWIDTHRTKRWPKTSTKAGKPAAP